MWKLAPEGTHSGIVLSPYGLAMLEKGFSSLLGYLTKAGPEMAPLEQQLDELLQQVGGKKFRLAALNLTPAKGAAIFRTREGMVAVVPVADRAAFLARVGGTPAATPDGLDQIDKVRCKMIGALYTCASTEELLGKVGKSSIKDRLTAVKARGDIEIVATELPLQGPSMPRSSIAAAIQLEAGAWVVRGMVGKAPTTMAEKLSGNTKPRTAVGGSSGFVMIDIRSIIESTDDKVVEGVTQADIVKSVSGPLTLDVPAGSSTFDIQIPLSNSAPLQTVVTRCGEVTALAGIAKFANGVCTLDLQQLNTSLDMWVEGNVLHLSKKGATPTTIKIPMSGLGRELATGTWGMAFWGRGTMFAPTGKPVSDVPQIHPLLAIQLRMLAALDEIGFGVKQDGDGLRFVLALRTTFADSQGVVDALAAITALDIASNRAEVKAKPVADANPSSQFAIDFTAGQHGILIPAQLLSTGISTIVPALISYMRPEPPPSAEEPPAPKVGELTRLRVNGYATDAYTMWKAKNADKACPASMEELGKAVSEEAEINDEWGHKLILRCGKDLPAGVKTIAIESWGFDGKPGTPDDLKSYGPGAEAPAPAPNPTPAPPTPPATPPPAPVNPTPAPAANPTPAPASGSN